MSRSRLPVLIVVLSTFGPLCGCVTRVRMPVRPVEPVDVFLVDYGRHSSLLLPDDGDKGLIEFTYGDWRWFALGKDGPLDVIPTIFLPTQGALGRWTWPIRRDARVVRRAIPCETVHTIIADDIT